MHRHVLCVVIRAYLDTRFSPVEGGGRKEARAGTLAPATKHAPAYICHSTSTSALPVMSTRIGTAAAVLCGSFYLYVVCIASEGGTLFLYVSSYSNLSSIYVPTLTPPSGARAKKKKPSCETNLACVPNDRCNSSARIRMRCVIVMYSYTPININSTSLG